MASLKKRGKTYQIQFYVGGKQRRVGLGAIPLQLAKEKLRQFESAQARGDDNPLPTKTPIPTVLQAYVEHIRSVKTPKSAQTDIYYLREAFGPVCDALRITSRKPSEAARKKPLADPTDRHRVPRIEANHFEEITTAAVATFVTTHTRRRGLAPKTANRYREILVRLFNWAMTQQGVRMPAGRNPAASVERYKERAPEIRYLTLPQIAEQLDALDDFPQLRAMVATYIYAGLRREEALWLQHRDVDLRRGLIQVRAKSVAAEHWQPKTRRNRSVPISPALAAELERYAARPSRGDWYFPSPQGARYDPDNFSRDLRAANRLASLPWGCLDYRHTFGSQLAQKGVSLYKISELMGNSPEICRRHYAALEPVDLDTAFRNSLAKRRTVDVG
jgi:integrase